MLVKKNLYIQIHSQNRNKQTKIYTLLSVEKKDAGFAY